MEKPEEINFKLLKQNAEDIIIHLENLIASTIKQINKKVLKPLKTERETDEIMAMKIDLINMQQSLEIKRAVFREYNLRCSEAEDRIKAEQDEFMANFDKVYGKAIEYSKNNALEKSLKEHLTNVLTLDASKFDAQKKITYYFSLKKEVQMCQTWMEFNKKA
jgi:hypothetical protein